MSDQSSLPRLDAALVWFRRDLRDVDNTALAEALRRAQRVYCVFVFDRDILDILPCKADRRVEFIHASVVELAAALRARGGGLIVREASARDEIPRLARELGVAAVFANRDYEPAAKARDAAVAARLQADGIAFEDFKDQVIFDGAEVLTQGGRPYGVFTPYRTAWLKRLGEDDLRAADAGAECGTLCAPALPPLPTLVDLGFAPTGLADLGIQPGMQGARATLAAFLPRLARYHEQRDFPAVRGVSYLSVHLRFGTVSIRQLVSLANAVRLGRGGEYGLASTAEAAEGGRVWLSELVWRDFYFMILDHFPQVVARAFKPECDAVVWETGAAAEADFAAWCAGRTGYPLVDAAMRQLAHSGYMHNRLRMVVAAFLCKDLGIDWRRGEAFFAEHLNDFDLAANNGGWQWSASTGCDAQPWFRIFNPVTQSQRFDPEGRFIRRYVPELNAVPVRHLHAPWLMSAAEQSACGVVIGRDYPAPCIDHAAARTRTLARYGVLKAAAGE
ncbi:deoxyribodipyrimidine photo-lyase [Rhodocyclus tenuis]|uniref:Deoxyribodipyrimidine photo-lyase n=1 Tax=Rhodocyclus gracilis TaxID=2929842 RepID=A0ABX0WL40_9RHOO|nr:deoxyribodipyrimidine photo-lyase [Rhodocyclus gracilis]NJA89310.1 deoxyribodipyrimidine photo-lyase [Rhodocyclus gracilis]